MNSLALITLTLGFAMGGPSAVPAQTTEDASTSKLLTRLDAKQLLQQLCSEKAGGAACEKDVLESHPQDEAWVVLNHACEKNPWHGTKACTAFILQRGGVLVFNLQTNEWTAKWEQASHPLKFDVTGTPTLRLKPRDAKPLKIVVEEISPLTYSATPGTAKEEDLSIVTGLKSFLALAGTGVQGLVQTITFSAAAGVPPAGSSTGTPFDPSALDKRNFRLPPPPPRECKIASPNVLPAAAHITAPQMALVNVGTAMSALEKALDKLDTAKSSFIRAAQKAEDRKSVSISELVKPDTEGLENAYKAVDETVAKFSASTEALASCQPLLGAYALLLGAPADGKVIVDLAKRVADIRSGCAGDFADLARSMYDNAALLADPLLADPSVCGSEKLKPIIERHRDAMKPLVERLLNAKQVEEKVWAAIDKIDAARKDILAGAGVLSRQVERGRRHTWDGALIRSLAVTRPNPELSWNKVQSHEIVMKADSPYVKEISLARGAEEKRAYKLESAAGQLLGYGIGLIYTPLHESTFGAVTMPGTTTKVVAETKRETRAGDLAAFLSYRFLEHTPAKRRVQPTVDFGVGLTSDRPAFFVGPGLEIGRAARIGIGWAPQRIVDLDPSQTVNVTVVSSADEIRTVKRFELANYYVSFTFALDSLSLFNSK